MYTFLNNFRNSYDETKSPQKKSIDIYNIIIAISKYQVKRS